MIKAILFDLDGTLLPMDMEVFVKAYVGGMIRKMVPYGYDPEFLTTAVWKCTTSMVANNSDVLNETIFWDVFCSVLGEKAREDQDIFISFYENEFHQLQSVCGYNPDALKTVRELQKMGYRTVLATNPVFPAIVTNTRLRWTGLDVSDFEMITTYENCRRCKPNPAYYEELLQTLNLKPQECIMVGNDTLEDLAAEKIGIRVFLITDCLINRENIDFSHIPHGSFPELMNYIRELKE